VAQPLQARGFFCALGETSPLFKLAPVLVRLDQVADRIVNANDFFVRADEILTAFVELQRAIHEFAVSLIL
jgi:hypothetical protein